MTRAKSIGTIAISVGLAGLACSSDPASPPLGAGGTAGGSSVGGGGSTAQAGTATLPGGTSNSGGMAGGTSAGTSGGGSAPSGGTTAGGSAGSAGTAGSAGSGTGGGGAGGGGAGKTPQCVTNAEQDGVDRAMNNYIECDVEDQAIDFDVMAAYPPPRKPGYDPSTTPVTFTDYGTAFTGSAVQMCHPYCYQGNLTLGLDLIAGADTSLRGEVLFGFPPTVAPIVAPSGRASLGWVWIDGPALPAGSKLNLQMVLKNDKGVVVAKETKDGVPQKWIEFRYFPIDSTFDKADLVNVTHIGFRVTLTPTAGATDWHGVIYADHFQLRK
ncbi:MAG TPA: hypothetical protein VHB79_06530 [Polyangiaceae bacterium]|nr:hypothetical protein [Polyangiaceae bacterium]